jgi:excisionase family DNA binding protein
VLTLPEAAAYLRVSEEALRELAAEQGVPARKIGAEWRFLKTALQEWLRSASPPSAALLLAELERRGLLKLAAQEPPDRKSGSKQRLLELAGIWKDDPSVDEMLREIYRRRGRPMTEEGE